MMGLSPCPTSSCFLASFTTSSSRLTFQFLIAAGFIFIFTYRGKQSEHGRHTHKALSDERLSDERLREEGSRKKADHLRGVGDGKRKK
ncbi:hypothetical protein ES703_106501 [subsurface metagenome]